MNRINSIAALMVFATSALPALAADLTAEQVKQILSTSERQSTAALAGKDLSRLDLSLQDFQHVNLARTSFFASKLVQCNFSGATLSGAILNGAWLMGANFSGADLSGAKLMSVVILGGEITARPTFKNANLSGARIIAELDGTDLSHANLSRAHLGVDIKNQGMGQMRTNLTKANLEGADLSGADANRSLLRFANLKDANLRGTDFFRADLSGADLTGADLSGANLEEADINGTIFKGVRGLDTVKGLNRHGVENQ